MFTTIQGSAHDIAQVADKSVQLVVTSPPYFNLRAYSGEQEIDWQEMSYSPMPGLPPITIPAQRAALGLEKDPFAYVGHLILCLREWRRVLRDDGLCFVNLGDSYNGSTMGGGNGSYSNLAGTHHAERTGTSSVSQRKAPGLKPKDLMQIPQRFALAAQADGWFLRNDIIWSKPNPMPESVQDRFTRSHEYIYMLAKSERYYFDSEAVKEPAQQWAGRAATFARNGAVSEHILPGQSAAVHRPDRTDTINTSAGRNRRTVWELATRPFGAAHFACFPPEIPEICIRAGTSARGCCPACSAPWRRVVERSGSYHTGNTVPKNQGREDQGLQSATSGLGQAGWRKNEPPTAITTGWEPTCTCDAGEPTPCVVLDPFSGSGTTGKVAVRLGRRYIGVDLSEKYLTEITEARMGAGVQMELSW